MKRRLVDFEAVKGQRKCQYCWQNIAFNMARTRNGRRWKCNECIEGATKAYDMEQIKANAQPIQRRQGEGQGVQDCE